MMRVYDINYKNGTEEPLQYIFLINKSDLMIRFHFFGESILIFNIRCFFFVIYYKIVTFVKICNYFNEEKAIEGKY